MNIEEDNAQRRRFATTATCSVMCILPITIVTSRAAAPLDFHALFEQLRADNYQGVMWCMKGVSGRKDPARAYRDSLAGCVPAKRSL